uniref:Lipoprotein n=1 Tax=Streptomyces sp. NBC_00003 TaxID=2903608 RepID=A0AAU2VCW2_9ACTN
MRKILLATAATACLALTACNPGGGGSGSKPSATRPTGGQPSATAPTPATSGTPGGGSATPGSGSGAGQTALALGVPSRTVGTKLVGILEITPTTVVYTKEGDGTTSRFGTFVVITTKDASLTANAADEEPADAKGAKGGWRWIAANGQSVAEGNGTAYKVLVSGYNGVGKIEPGTYQMRSEVFDLTPEQAKGGGTLVYTDATKSENRWTIPAVDSGPQIADVKKRLAS